jgi:isoamylase
MDVQARPGRPFPLGVHLRDGGANVAVYSSVADAVELCLYDEHGVENRVRLPGKDDGIWHAFVPGLAAGQQYAFRVHGPWEPAAGRRCNANKVLLDPYARAISGHVIFEPAVYGYDVHEPARASALDSAPVTPRSVLVEPFDRRAVGPRPGHHLNDSVIYEIHVKGFTARHPDIPPELRGTYAGLAHPAAVDHLRRLGVTAVELLPVHHHVSEPFLIPRGLTNYWGYNTIGYFAPHAAYSAEVRAGRPGGQVAEFRDMVTVLHDAGIEVILDVVYNHTAEGDAGGPTLSFRGLDNAVYYRLDPGDPSRYVDTSGCGNALNVGDPTCLRLIMDSLRYWVTEMGVDGFRFDLAPSLARQDGSFIRLAAFFDLVWQDPVIAQVKLIAEPWDVGQKDSYDVGRFPPGWSEWNGRFRDTVRDVWRSHDGLLPDLATRLAGSSDLYGPRRRGPDASINLITVHDGFTLTDLVSYDRKHNEANTERNRDGTDDNRSWNCGVEGPTDRPDVLALRDRQRRAMLSTLLLARGVPLLLGGDELGRTQGGNNNAYCQDNAITWFDWTSVDDSLRDFTASLIALRHAHPALRRRGYPVDPDAMRWMRPDGAAMTAADWADPEGKSIAMVVAGTLEADLDDEGAPMVDDDLAVLINAWWEPETFTLPWPGGAPAVIESDSDDPSRAGRKVDGSVLVGPRSVVLLRRG